jgi:hypothetical protein
MKPEFRAREFNEHEEIFLFDDVDGSSVDRVYGMQHGPRYGHGFTGRRKGNPERGGKR